MQISKPQIWSFGRHVLTFAMGGITVGAMFHVLTAGQATDATTAVNQVASGVQSIVAGMTTLIGIGSGLYAAYTASPLSQIKSVSANPDVSKIVTTPAIASATPSSKVVPGPAV